MIPLVETLRSISFDVTTGAALGHHFDSPEARADSRINITDNYLFASPDDVDGKLVAVMCISPLAGVPSPYHGEPQWRTFRPGAGYELRFDLDGDLVADCTLRFVFDGDDAPQRWTLHRIDGPDAWATLSGTELMAGTVGETTGSDGGWRVWIDEAGDPFWLDAVAAKVFLDGVLDGATWNPESFSGGSLTTGATNVLAIVVEIPMTALTQGPMGYYTAVTGNDHGAWTQVARCGRPNFAATFVDSPDRSKAMNESQPIDDLASFGPDVAAVVSRVVAGAGTHPDPTAYARRAERALLPDVIPYDPSWPAGMDFAGINGRTLTDDFGALVYSVVYCHPMRTAIPPLADLRTEWPWLSPARPLPTGPAVDVPARNE